MKSRSLPHFHRRRHQMPPKKIPSPGDEASSPSNSTGSQSSSSFSSSSSSDSSAVSEPVVPETSVSSSSSDSSAVSEPVVSETSVSRGRRLMPVADEVLLLEAVLTYREKHGRMPPHSHLAAEVQWSEDGYSADQISKHLHSLRVRSYGTNPKTEDQEKVYRLSQRIWEPKERPRKRKPSARLPRQDPPREFSQLADLYPNLAGVVQEIDSGSGAYKMALGSVTDDTAAALEENVKRLRVAQSRVKAKRNNLASVFVLELIK